ncbi:DUF397 domain-containing protein [Streptomyces sp. AC512_CC834]|uniref:DUF397 domain-containing protein n=1 Tax=Streptomyces sp. AC512_CC834 TaxID=2823691 RepID=UPI001C2657BB|nr:DUF397 domain-containing protein [Streptomyces sp. AC512_CC834]
MGTPGNWRKSSYSGPGDGNSCVEIANSPTLVAVRDSKTPATAALAFPPTTFATFVDALKPAHSTVTDFARLRG